MLIFRISGLDNGLSGFLRMCKYLHVIKDIFIEDMLYSKERCIDVQCLVCFAIITKSWLFLGLWSVDLNT